MQICKIFDSVPIFYHQRRHFKSHRRLGLFYQKGYKCVWCGIEGNKVIKWKDATNHDHYDLYYWDKDKKIMMTVDHIIPKSLGGTRNWKNLQPMCSKCNTLKGNKLCLPYRPC